MHSSRASQRATRAFPRYSASTWVWKSGLDHHAGLVHKLYMRAGEAVCLVPERGDGFLGQGAAPGPAGQKSLIDSISVSASWEATSRSFSGSSPARRTRTASTLRPSNASQWTARMLSQTSTNTTLLTSHEAPGAQGHHDRSLHC